MEDEASIFLDGKTLANLRVVDLKQELEKRGLSKSGSKKDLVKRLKQQLEFEKLCGERKSTGDCDLKLELDADTEQNEFVQQYLAQQQKIYAEQKEAKRLVELEGTQKSGDEKESCDSITEDNDNTEDETEPEPKHQGVDKESERADFNKSPITTITLPLVDRDLHNTDIKIPEVEVVFKVDVDGGSPKDLTVVSSSSVDLDVHSTTNENNNQALEAISVVVDRETKDNKTETYRDHEKELSTAISSLLSTEKDVHNANIESESEEVGIASEVFGEGNCTKDLLTVVSLSTVSQVAHSAETKNQTMEVAEDEDREKNLATAVLSSLLVNQEVNGSENDTKNEKVVEDSEMEIGDGGKKDHATAASSKPSVQQDFQSDLDPETDSRSENLDIALAVTEKPSVESSETIQLLNQEVSVKMDVSSVPYSLSEIQLPESPGDIVKASPKVQSVENKSVKATDTEVEFQSNGVDSEGTKKQQAAFEDVNGKNISIGKDDKASEMLINPAKDIENTGDVSNKTLKKESDDEKSLNTLKIKNLEGGMKKKSKFSEILEDCPSDSDSVDDQKKKLKPKEVRRKERDRIKKNDSSCDERSPDKSAVKKFAGSPKFKDQRRKEQRKSPSSEDDRRKILKKDFRVDGDRKRNASSDDDQCSTDHSKEGSLKRDSSVGWKERDRKGKSQSSEDHNLRTRCKESPKKDSRVEQSEQDRRRKSVSSEEEQHFGTHSKEILKKKSRAEWKEQDRRSVSSEEEQQSSIHSKESLKKDYFRVEQMKQNRRSVSSDEEHRSKAQSKENPKIYTKADRNDKDKKRKVRSSEDEHDLYIRSRESSPKTSPASTSDIFEKIKQKDHKRKSQSISSDDEHRSKLKESLTKKCDLLPVEIETKSDEVSEKGHDLKKRYKDSGDDRAEIQSHSRDGTKTRSRELKKDEKRKHKGLVESHSKSRTQSRDSSPEKKYIEKSVKISAESFYRTKLGEMKQTDQKKRSKSPQATCISQSSDTSSEKGFMDTCNKPTVLSKTKYEEVTQKEQEQPQEGNVSEGELTSSRESSPGKGSLDVLEQHANDTQQSKCIDSGNVGSCRTRSKEKSIQKISFGKHSGEFDIVLTPTLSDKVESKESSISVIKKEAPKQRLKIKRDNVIISKKTEVVERLPIQCQSKNDDSVSKLPESTEKKKTEAEESSKVPPITYVSRKITLSSRKRNEKSGDEPTSKRSKWGSFAASRKAKQTVSISTDSLKNWFPDFKLLKEPAPMVELMPEEYSPSVKEVNDIEMVVVERDSEGPKMSVIPSARKLEQPIEEESMKVMDTHLDDGVIPTCILFVRNLVRPFTLLQLKELLKETGNMVEEGFWIDKIKSKCFVTYETEAEAMKTRCVLNGARWPSSNPKILCVDFATEEDLVFHKSGAVVQPKSLPLLPASNQPHSHEEPRNMPADRERRRNPSERDNRRDRSAHLQPPPMREWDKDKITQEESPHRVVERGRSDERKEKKEAKRKPNEDTPAKLLDDLFQKTKSTPCIYWLPLTDEQAKERAESQRLRKLERERRDQEENKRPRSRQRMRDTENRRSSTRSRSPPARRR